MEKGLCIGAMVVSGLMLLLFVLDLIMEIPFGGSAFMVPDIAGLIAAAILGYLSFNAYQDVK